ncbi:MAG TPA: lipopolysaccharide kinase InaA family protein [Tepidisphaeraceae bacterium]|jgi:tRNA A-37 threonylcarbamoyl transferase component Bud32
MHITSPVTTSPTPSSLALEQALRNFDRLATLVRDDAERQAWRFEFEGRTYLVIFHPRHGALTRVMRRGSAMGEFVHLQALQRAGIPAPRAVAQLAGFRIRDSLGDALIVEAVPGAVQLDEYLKDHVMTGRPVPMRREIARQVIDIVNQLGRAKLGHRRLGLDCFLVGPDGKVRMHDVRGLRGGGLRMQDLLSLAHDAARFCTRTELERGWDSLEPDLMWPRDNRRSRRLWNRFVARTTGENESFGRIVAGQWKGSFVKSLRLPTPWSAASRLRVERRDWESAWPTLLAQMESDQLTCVKSDSSGEILSGEVVLAGRPISVMIKRPRRKFWYRYVADVVRESRARRTWRNAWKLLARNLPCEWPLLVMERSVMGYVADAVVIFERVPGQPLDKMDLDAMNAHDREMLFHRAGRTLRRIEQTGLAHTDAKSTNWIVYDAPGIGPLPVMIDPYGIRPLTFFLQLMGIRRLLRAMKLHPEYTPADSLALCQGFAPFAGRFVQEDGPGPEPERR